MTLPLIGSADLATQSLALSTAIIAFVDGFNPCSLWVLSVLLARSGVRVHLLTATRNEVIKRNQESEVIQYRKQGVPASKIDAALVEPNVEFILAAADADLFKIGPVTEIELPAGRLHDFHTVICAECGEVAVERYARVKNGQIVCMPCAEKN